MHGVAHQASDFVNVELFHKLTAMRLHGLDRQVQVARDFLGTLTFSNELQHFAGAVPSTIRMFSVLSSLDEPS